MYVAYSLVTSLKGLYIIDKAVVPTGNEGDKSMTNQALNEMNRLRANCKLQLCYDVEIKGSLSKIAYLNIQHLNKEKLKQIECDHWYKQFDVLIFCEIYLKPKHSNHHLSYDDLKLSNFTIAYRNDAYSGIICYIQNEVYNRETRNGQQIEFSVETEAEIKSGRTKFHYISLNFKLGELNIFTGYKSPQTPSNVFQKTFEKLYLRIKCDNEKCIKLGDFNNK